MYLTGVGVSVFDKPHISVESANQTSGRPVHIKHRYAASSRPWRCFPLIAVETSGEYWYGPLLSLEERTLTPTCPYRRNMLQHMEYLGKSPQSVLYSTTNS